ncbi:hypothetical protein TKK_0016661 [Trichogramma kaykai]
MSRLSYAFSSKRPTGRVHTCITTDVGGHFIPPEPIYVRTAESSKRDEIQTFAQSEFAQTRGGSSGPDTPPGDRDRRERDVIVLDPTLTGDLMTNVRGIILGDFPTVRVVKGR